MSEWQKIETAPKTGDDILALSEGPAYWVVYWNGRGFECVASAKLIDGLCYWTELQTAPRDMQP